MADSFDEVVTSVWRQILVQNAKIVWEIAGYRVVGDFRPHRQGKIGAYVRDEMNRREWPVPRGIGPMTLPT